MTPERDIIHRTLRVSAALCLTLVAAGAAAQTAVVVDGTVETTAGGVTFPDATTQTTAARREYYAGVVLVAKGGGQFTSVQAALDSITEAAADNRYLVRVAPGVYAERVTMKSWVDIEGSGPGVTVITAGGADVEDDAWTVLGADAALRSLTVENTGGGQYAEAIRNVDVSPRLHDLAINIGGASLRAQAILNSGSSPLITEAQIVGASETTGSVFGVVGGDGASVDLRHVEIDLSGPGFNTGVGFSSGSLDLSFSKVTVREGSFTEGIASGGPAYARHVSLEIAGTAARGVRCFGPMTLDHVEVEVKAPDATFGIRAETGATVTVLHSRIEATDSPENRALDLNDGTIKVGNSLINGPVSLAGTSSITCVGAFDDNYTPHDATCQ